MTLLVRKAKRSRSRGRSKTSSRKRRSSRRKGGGGGGGGEGERGMIPLLAGALERAIDAISSTNESILETSSHLESRHTKTLQLDLQT